MTLERDIEHRLQRLILRAKGMGSEEMLAQHRREIPVDEIPDYAVTHLLVELGEQGAAADDVSDADSRSGPAPVPEER